MIEIGMQHQKEDYLIPGTCVVLNIRLRNDQIARQVVYRAWQTYTIPGIILDKKKLGCYATVATGRTLDVRE